MICSDVTPLSVTHLLYAVHTLRSRYRDSIQRICVSMITDRRAEDRSSPHIGQYRRVQLARLLIDEGISDGHDFRLDGGGRLADFGMSEQEVTEIVEAGVPSMTSGCIGRNGQVACNRPYGNSPPGPDIRNYSFRPDGNDVERIKGQLWT